MKSNQSIPKSTVTPVLVYPDVRKAVAWLCKAFDFTEHLQIGEDHRSQLNVGGGSVIIADATYGRIPPENEKITHQTMVRIEDTKTHCEHAREYGVRILKEPSDFPYGERQYEAEDLAGHMWIFTETIKDVDPKEWGWVTQR